VFAVAALIAVPLPFRTPVMLVESVMAGVVVALATVPANPLADTTETVVTVPDPPPPPTVAQEVLVPSVVKYLPELVA
jgi:hypothetical protein